MTPRKTGLIIVVILLAVAVVWYFKSFRAGSNPPLANQTPSTSSTVQNLGAQVYQKANNPLNGLSTTSSTVPNPIQNLYQNPFR